MIEIMNLRNTKPTQPYDVIVDRRNPLGNPFHLGDESCRDWVCDKYQDWFDEAILQRNEPWRELQRLITLYKEHEKLKLFCWCAPKRCHGETLKKYLEKI